VTKLPVKNDANKHCERLGRDSQFQVDKTASGMITSPRRRASVTETIASPAS